MPSKMRKWYDRVSVDWDLSFEDREEFVAALEEMEEDIKFLRCLEGAGVDNWDGYGYAQDMMEDD